MMSVLYSVQWHAAAAAGRCAYCDMSVAVCVCVYNNDWLPIQVQREFVNAVGNAQKMSQTCYDVRTAVLVFYRRTNLRTEILLLNGK